MELTIDEERPNPLLKRTEYRFSVMHAAAATPKRAEVRDALAHAAKVPLDRLVIEEMHARYGVARTIGRGFAYASKEAMQATVRGHIQVRNGLKAKEEKKTAAAPTAPAPSPPPAAEKPA